jgi:hypothetical protein
MVSYGGICSKVWNAVSSCNIATTASKDAVHYLDFQIRQWLEAIPPELRLIHPRLGDAGRGQPRNLQRLRVLLYIRANHMRIFVHRHHILSPTSISQNLISARLVMDIAKDTIRVLVHLRETSTIYEMQQTAFNYFLVSAISAIFLGVCHAPVEFSHSCRIEFYSALGLLSTLSAHSYITRRLWKSVKGLREIASHLGLGPARPLVAPLVNENPNNNDGQQEQRLLIGSGQPLMTCLPVMHSPPNKQAGPPSVEDTSRAPVTSSSTTLTAMSDFISPSALPDIYQMGNELTTLFEAIGHHSHIDGPRPLQTAAPACMTDEINLLQNSADVSRLFEGLL